ncbi:MAG: HD domain-containing protein [Saprospiraceae bacterium]|nr:HD domain-containing protein [Saprospiraceae bacterium]
MKNRKIINDPVHGFISLPFESIFAIIQHPYFQRLRRIKQLGLTDFVYPGAVHTRFHHALGALHLMTEALRTLIYKGIKITDKECEAACIAILVHDIGHGPFSHALEHLIAPKSHEDISLEIMELLNATHKGQLSMAIDIFTGEYEKYFLHELVSSQLDMDRMDYLTRDSFFTGVAEGVVGYDRIIKMLNVVDNRLVVEEKALYSIQKFLLARHFMYWQVYLHKTVLSTEIMLQEFYKRIEAAYKEGKDQNYSPGLQSYFENGGINGPFELAKFVELDDNDLLFCIKNMTTDADEVIQTLSYGLKNRELFKLILSDRNQVDEIRRQVETQLSDNSKYKGTLKNMIFTGEESTTFYSEEEGEILILKKSGEVDKLSNITQFQNVYGDTIKSYVSFPKSLMEDLDRTDLE